MGRELERAPGVVDPEHRRPRRHRGRRRVWRPGSGSARATCAPASSGWHSPASDSCCIRCCSSSPPAPRRAPPWRAARSTAGRGSGSALMYVGVMVAAAVHHRSLWLNGPALVALILIAFGVAAVWDRSVAVAGGDANPGPGPHHHRGGGDPRRHGAALGASYRVVRPGPDRARRGHHHHRRSSSCSARGRCGWPTSWPRSDVTASAPRSGPRWRPTSTTRCCRRSP